MNLASLNLASIDLEDKTFRITTDTRTEYLILSIKSVGLLNPPILIKKTSSFQIISGFMRIFACLSLGMAQIPAMVVNSDRKKLECVKFAITENSLQRTLNLVELSRSFYMLSEFYKDDNKMVGVALELGLPDNPTFIKKIINLCKLPQPVQKGVLSNNISLAVALELEMFGKDEGDAFATLFNDLKLSLNKQREIINRVKEISIRDEISVLSLLETGCIRKIVKNKDMDRARKVNKIRLFLKQKRFPEISKAEANFEKLIKELKLGKDMKLIHPKDFEGRGYRLNLYFESLEKLKKHKVKLDKIIQNPSLEDILG